jgi:membrane protein
MTMVGQRFLQGEPPCSVVEMAQQIGVPTRLVQQILQTLSAAHLAVETVGPDPAYLPARPIETITCHHVLEAMRAPKGQEMATREEPTQRQVFGEFERIQEAERKAASAVTMLTLVHRAQDQLEHEPVKSLKGHSSSHSSA